MVLFDISSEFISKSNIFLFLAKTSNSIKLIQCFIVATEDQQCRSDMNQDGTTDIFDVIIMVNIILEG